MTSGKMVTHFPSSARWIDNARGAALVQELQNPAGKGTEGGMLRWKGKGRSPISSGVGRVHAAMDSIPFAAIQA